MSTTVSNGYDDVQLFLSAATATTDIIYQREVAINIYHVNNHTLSL